jgi:CrcB protein
LADGFYKQVGFMQKLILVGIGGGIGAVMRFLMSGWVQNGITRFPLGTLAVNFTGTLFLGLVMFSSEYLGLFDDEARIFLTTGIAGGYTTMSTFSYETLGLFEQGEYAYFALNLAGTLLLMFLAIWMAKAMVIRMTAGG